MPRSPLRRRKTVTHQTARLHSAQSFSGLNVSFNLWTKPRSTCEMTPKPQTDFRPMMHKINRRPVFHVILFLWQQGASNRSHSHPHINKTISMIHWLELLTLSHGLHQQISNWANVPWYCAPSGLLIGVGGSFFTFWNSCWGDNLNSTYVIILELLTVTQYKSPDSGETVCPSLPVTYRPLLVRFQNLN